MADQTTGLLSPFLRRTRIQAALPYLLKPILDVGCGNGPLSIYFNPQEYLGVDIDLEALHQARTQHPQHSFCHINDIPRHQQFNTIALLALIEHLPKPATYLKQLKQFLTPSGTLVITTPHPSFDRIYGWGVRAGIFSAAAHQEHQDLIDTTTMSAIASSIGMKLVYSRRFLWGANQIFLLKDAK